MLEWVALIQGIFPIQGSNPSLLHCRQILYHLSHHSREYMNPLLIATGEAIPLRGLEGVPGLPGVKPKARKINNSGSFP